MDLQCRYPDMARDRFNRLFRAWKRLLGSLKGYEDLGCSPVKEKKKELTKSTYLKDSLRIKIAARRAERRKRIKDLLEKK